MEEQEWTRSARRRAPLRSNHAPSGAETLRARRTDPALSTRGASTANKPLARKNEPPQNGNDRTPVAAPSRWKEMRQAVRVKATIDTADRRMTNARIADLCDEDREKVAKLVRRIVEVSALHEDSEKEFARQRSLMESEIHELRGHAKRDAHEIEELSEKLKAALEKVRDYQERVLVLEESNEAEVRHRMETDQTVDLLKLEVDKLRKLVKKQKHEMEAKENAEQRKHREEMERMAQELKETHELLLKERRERLEDKQRALDERIERSVSPRPVPTAAPASAVATNRYDPPRPETGRNSVPLDLSVLLNSSAELPDKIKEIMNEWKTRMEDALNATAASIREDSSGLFVSTACQTDIDGGNNALRDMPRPIDHVSRNEKRRHDYDGLLPSQTTSRREGTRITTRDNYAETASPGSSRSRRSRLGRDFSHETPRSNATNHERSVTRTLLPDFANASAFVEGDSFEYEVESTMALIDDLQSPPYRPTVRSSPRRRNLSLFDSSIVDVVDAIETADIKPTQYRGSFESSPSTTSGRREEESPSTKVERLIQGLQVREQKLARVSELRRPREPSFLHDVELFNEVKDVYEEHLQETRQHHANDDDYYDHDHDDDELAYDDKLTPVSSPRSLSVQEAIERDMQDLLRSEGLGHLHRQRSR